ncbi:hypothetical protein GCM10028857_26840 [Salinarchaeum chitinilyticum]
MPSSSAATSDTSDAVPSADRPIPELVDWLVGTVLVIVGLASVLGGAALYSVVDRSEIREAVANENVQIEGLSDPETVDVVQALGNWSAAGLIATGAILAVAGIAYVLLRRRTHSRAAAGEPVSHYGANAVLGALVAVVLAFLPGSQALGGFVAGYLESPTSDRETSVGAVAGALSTVPAIVVLVFVGGGVTSGLLAIGEAGPALVVVAGALLVVTFLVAIGGGLGAIGGHLGGRFGRGEQDRSDGRDSVA